MNYLEWFLHTPKTVPGIAGVNEPNGQGKLQHFGIADARFDAGNDENTDYILALVRNKDRAKKYVGHLPSNGVKGR